MFSMLSLSDSDYGMDNVTTLVTLPSGVYLTSLPSPGIAPIYVSEK